MDRLTKFKRVLELYSKFPLTNEENKEFNELACELNLTVEDFAKCTLGSGKLQNNL